MRIDEKTLARIYSFDLQFKGGRRTKFYRKLFGFKSKTKREDKEGRERVYENFYPGLVSSLPHLRLGKSVIAVPKTAESILDSFFEDSKWGAIDLYSFDGILPSDDRMRAMEEALRRIRVTRDETLRSEIGNLLSLKERGDLGPDMKQRVMRVLEKVRDLVSHDWTEDQEFSKEIKTKISPLKKENR